jgi:molybdopterin-binding protein
MIELTTENSGITLEASNVQGEIRIEMTAAQTAALTTSGVYDLELIQGADVIKVIKGNFTLNLEVTR